jgi:glycosyltransferase involved in cell wall biosynthesis
MNAKKYKIALVGFRMGAGGSEKVMANLSLFFEQKGIEIHNIIVSDSVSYDYAGKLINLGLLKNKTNGFLNQFQRMVAFNNYIKNNNFDFIIDFRFRIKPLQELIISRFIYNTKTIFTVHHYLIHHYMPNTTWLTRWMYNDCYANVAIVDKMTQIIIEKHHLKNVVQIANPLNIEEAIAKSNHHLDLKYDYIIAVGQFENPLKQFDKLILSYADSRLVEKNIHLVILGNGNKPPLEKIAKALNVTDFVHFLGFQDNPFKYMKKAKFLILSSHSEGFANVLVESLACETPVISFDCPCGPSDIIIDKENGLLVENQNTTKLTEAINLLTEDNVLYQHCKQNTLQSIQKFSLENIGEKWLDLMQINLNNDNN